MPRPPTTIATRELFRELACDAKFYALRGRTFVACQQELLFLNEAGEFQSDAVHSVGLKLSAHALSSPWIVGMAGQWPAAAWAATAEVAAYGNATKLRFFHWQNGRWREVGASAELGAQSSVVFPWGDGLVALTGEPFEKTRLFAFGVKPLTVPALTKAVQSKEEAAQYRCRSAMIAPEAWARLAPTDVMVFAGQLCGVPGKSSSEVPDRFFGLERLRAGQKNAELTLLPLPAELPRDTTWFDVVAAALSPTEVLVAAGGVVNRPKPDEATQRFSYLAHFDGQEWRIEPAPLGEIAQLWAEAGVFWALDGHGTLWLRRHAAWSSIEWNELGSEAAALFRHGQITQIHASETGTLWLVRSEERPGGEFTSRVYRVRLEP